MTFPEARFRVCAIVLLVAATALYQRNPEAIKDAAIRRGDELAGMKQYVEAAAEYRRAADADPTDGGVQKKLAETYRLTGDSTKMFEAAVRASDLLPDDVEAQLQAATLMLAQFRFLDAADRTAVLLRNHPADVHALVLHGNATARLFNSTWSLYKLAEVVRDKTKLDAARRDVRPVVSRSDDATAERELREALSRAPTMTEAQLALANFLWTTGRVEEGEDLLRTVADQVPGHTIANYALGAFYLARDRGVEAERYLRNAAVGGEEGRGARFALADYYVATNRHQEARQLLDSMSAADDASGDLSVRLAADDMRSGKPADAVRRLDALIGRIPQHGPALVLKAQILLAMGNPDLRYARAAVAAAPQSTEARTTLGQALWAAGDLGHALDEYVEARRLNPDAPEILLALARLSLALERAPEALQYARDAVRLDSADQNAALALVQALVLKKDYVTAEAALKPLLSRTPDDVRLLVQAGTIHGALGGKVAARTAFVRALEVDPESLDALSGLLTVDPAAARQRLDAAMAAHADDGGYVLLAARVYAAVHDSGRAEAALRQVLEADGTNLKAGLSLAEFLVNEGRPDEAARALRQLIERRPGSLEAQTALAALLEKTGHAADAQKLYEQIVAEHPGAATASFRLAALYVAQGTNLDRALDLAIAAKRELPEDPAVSDAVGWIYAQKGLLALALPPLKDAVQAAPNDAVYRYHLGVAYQRSGRVTEARREFTRALEIDTAFAYAEQARKALGSRR